MRMKILTLAAATLLTFSLAPRALAADPMADLERSVDQFDAGKLPAHPRLLLTPPEVKRVRAAAASPEGKAYWDAVRQFVDADRGKPILADPAGFPGGKWNVEDWRRIVAVGGEAQNHIMAAAFAAVVTGDEQDIAEAKRWVLSVADYNPHGATGIEGVDHPARDILHAMALAYDWLYDRWTPAEREKVRTCIAERGRGMYKHLNPYHFDSENNHPWFQTSALVDAGLAIADDVPEADAWWRYGARLYFTEFLPRGGRDGDWHEGTHYVSYTLIFVYQFADVLRSATGIDAYQLPWLRKVGYFRLYIAPPTAAVGIHFNDNEVRAPDFWDKMVEYKAAAETHDPVLQWYAESITLPAKTPLPALYALVYRDASLPARPPGKDLPLAVHYRDSGWAVFRTDLARPDDVQFGFKAGPYKGSKASRGHDHPGQNGFLINALGETLAVDSGYYDFYGSPHHNGWTFTGRAHNTILVDGQQQLVGRDGKMIAVGTLDDGSDYCTGEAAQCYPDGLLESWRRTVVFVRPNTFVIYDAVKPTKPVEITWLLHGPAPFKLDGRQGGQAFSVQHGKAEMVGRVVTPTDLTVSQWTGFPKDAQPERKKDGDRPDQSHLEVKTKGKVGPTAFVTVLKVGPTGTALPEVRASNQDGTAKVELEGKTFLFTEQGVRGR
jgi:hypothetical protein